MKRDAATFTEDEEDALVDKKESDGTQLIHCARMRSTCSACTTTCTSLPVMLFEEEGGRECVGSRKARCVASER